MLSNLGLEVGKEQGQKNVFLPRCRNQTLEDGCIHLADVPGAAISSPWDFLPNTNDFLQVPWERGSVEQMRVQVTRAT